jgi:phenylacetate-CoA ligase
VRDGDSGTIALTNLVNRGTVLVNYRMSDLARWTDEPCACGRTLRRLADVDGRLEDMLHLPNGDLLHPRGIWGLLKPHPEVLQYQLVQREPTGFLLKLVTASDDDYARLAAGIASEMASVLGAGATVATERCTELPREAGGKVRMVVALRGQIPISPRTDGAG